VGTTFQRVGTLPCKKLTMKKNTNTSGSG